MKKKFRKISIILAMAMVLTSSPSSSFASSLSPEDEAGAEILSENGDSTKQDGEGEEAQEEKQEAESSEETREEEQESEKSEETPEEKQEAGSDEEAAEEKQEESSAEINEARESGQDGEGQAKEETLEGAENAGQDTLKAPEDNNEASSAETFESTEQPAGEAAPEGAENAGAAATPEGTVNAGAAAAAEGAVNAGAAAATEGAVNASAAAAPEGTVNAGAAAAPEGTVNASAAAAPGGTENAGAAAAPEGTLNAGAAADPEGTLNAGAAAAPEGTLNAGTAAAPEGAVNAGAVAATEGTENAAAETASDSGENPADEKTDIKTASENAGGTPAETASDSVGDPGVIILKDGENAENIEGTQEIPDDDDDEDDDDKDRKKKDKDKDKEDEDSGEEGDALLEQDAEEEITFVPGNINMEMDFSRETVADIARATSEVQTGKGNASLASIDDYTPLPSKYYYSYENYVTTPTNQGNTAWCWAYTAASLAETSMIKNGIKTKKQLTESPVSVRGIVESSYNPERYDYYGETWDRATDTMDFDPSSDKLNDGLYYRPNTSKDPVSGAKKWDFTGYCLTTNTMIGPGGDYSKAKGNLINTVFNFERWAAPNCTGTKNFEGNTDLIDAQLENAYWVPNTDIDSIKRMIRDCGSAGIQIKLPENRIDISGDGVRKCSVPVNGIDQYKYVRIYNKYTTNHTVALVAWDDTVSREYFDAFNDKPSSDGAFLAKSSWPNEDGSGFFWISYEDAAFRLFNGKYKYAVAYDFVSSKKNDFTYGYDGTNHFGTHSIQQVFGIYKSSHSGETSSGKVEILKSVGVGVQDPGKYKLTIYYGYNSGASNTEKQYLNLHEMESETVQINYPGYHTIELEEPILFYKGDEISVCFEKADGTNFEMLVDGFHNGNTKTRTGHPISEIEEKTGENGERIIYHSFTRSAKSKTEAYFATYSGSKSVVSGNGVPVPGNSNQYMSLTPRMRLYTSVIQMPSSIDQTMLDIKLKKYIWLYNDGKAVCPDPEILIDFTKTRPKVPKDRGGRAYESALVMYNHYKTPSYASNKEAGMAAVIVRGTGDIFSGEISSPFKIVKGEQRIEKCKVFGLDPQQYRQGSDLNTNYDSIRKNIVIRYYMPETRHYVTLTEGVDYKIGSIEEAKKGSNKPGGKLTIMITGLGTFKNTIKPKIKIQKANQDKPISDGDVEVKLSYTDEDKNTTRWVGGIMAQTEEIVKDSQSEHTLVLDNGELPELPYIGKRIVLNIDKVYDFGTGTELQAGVHYKAKISFKNNKNPGMATLTIKALKGSGYSGKLVRRFMITPMHITTDATVRFKDEVFYTGNPIKLKPTVKLYGNKISGKDLYVAYENNTGSSSGEATARGTVFGARRYTGYIGYGTFTIKPKKT